MGRRMAEEIISKEFVKYRDKNENNDLNNLYELIKYLYNKIGIDVGNINSIEDLLVFGKAVDKQKDTTQIGDIIFIIKDKLIPSIKINYSQSVTIENGKLKFITLRGTPLNRNPCFYEVRRLIPDENLYIDNPKKEKLLGLVAKEKNLRNDLDKYDIEIITKIFNLMREYEKVAKDLNYLLDQYEEFHDVLVNNKLRYLPEDIEFVESYYDEIKELQNKLLNTKYKQLIF